jgi:8-oxo-dGTP diphosphatase
VIAALRLCVRRVPEALKLKAYAYITHRDRLLIFRHPDSPEAGIQVPGGTVDAGEDPGAAVLREAREETGLTDLVVVGLLGEATRNMSDFPFDFAPGEMHHRFFFHLRCGSEPPEAWRHYERFATGVNEPITFDFFWAAMPDEVPDLIADQGVLLPQLAASLSNGRNG